MFLAVNYLGERMGNSILTLVLQISLGAVIYLSLCIVYILVDKNNCIHRFLLKRKIEGGKTK